MQDWIESDEAPWEKVNENFDSLRHQAVYGQRQDAHNGLTWGYYGGRWGGFSVADGTLTLGNNATNYLVVARATGVISASTSTTNWNDADNYARVYRVVTVNGQVTNANGTDFDYRAGPGGVHGSAAQAGAGTELRGLTFTADTGSTADTDPGAGLFKWNNATQSSATVLYIDEATADAVNVDATLAAMDAGTLHIQQANDAARWQRWSYNATPIDGTGYWRLTVALLEKSSGDIQDEALCYFDFDDEGAGAADQQYTVSGVPTSDDTYAGRAITGVNAGATIAQWEAVYMGSGGEWLLADATDDTAAPMRGLAAAAGTDGNPMAVVTEGVVRNDAWAWTPGGTLYLSTTAGALTQTAPSAAGEIVQAVGFAITADVIYLNVGAATFLEVAA